MNSEPLSESSPSRGNGSRERIRWSSSNTHTWALFLRAAGSVQPVATSVASRLWQ